MNRGQNFFQLGQRTLRPIMRNRNDNDIFKYDPFKIQSYNFHYAERPTYMIQNFRRPDSIEKTFETQYYNTGFDRRYNKENINATPLIYNQSNQNNQNNQNNSNRFQETRRRKYLQNFHAINTIKTLHTEAAAALFKRVPNVTVAPQQRAGGANDTVAATAFNCVKPASQLRTSYDRDYLRPSCGSGTMCLGQRASCGNLLTQATSSRKLADNTFKNAAQQAQQRQNPAHLRQQAKSLATNNFNEATRQRTPSRSSLNGLNATATTDADAYRMLRTSRSMQHLPRSNFNPIRGTGTLRGGHYQCRTRALAGAGAGAGAGVSVGTGVNAGIGVGGNNIQRDVHQTTSRSVLNATLTPKRSQCSGCEININISSMDNDDGCSDNVCINIEADNCLIHTNGNKNNNEHNTYQRNLSLNRNKSLDSIAIDKRLSKFDFENAEANAANAATINSKDLRERIRKDLARERQRFAERQRARAREHEQEEEREGKREHCTQLHEHKQQNKLEQLYQMPTVSRLQLPVHTLRSRFSSERLPSIVPYNNTESTTMLPLKSTICKRAVTSTAPKLSSKTNADGNIRAQRMQATQHKCRNTNFDINVLNSLGGMKRSSTVLERKISQTSNNVSVNSVSSLSSVRLLPRSSSFIANIEDGIGTTNEPKLLNTGMPIHARANNMQMRVTSSRQRITSTNEPDLTFNTMSIRSNAPVSMMSRRSEGDCNPYNVNINVFADGVRLVRI